MHWESSNDPIFNQINCQFVKNVNASQLTRQHRSQNTTPTPLCPKKDIFHFSLLNQIFKQYSRPKFYTDSSRAIFVGIFEDQSAAIERQSFRNLN